MDDFSKRVALLHLAEDEANEPTYQEWLKAQPVSGVSNPISNLVLSRVKSKLGATAMPFFALYGQTRQMLDGAPGPEGGLASAWRDAMRALNRAIALKLGDKVGPPLINSVYDRMITVRPILKKLEQGYGAPTFRLAGDQLAQIISDVCKAAGVPVTLRPGPDLAKWPLIRRASEKEEQLDQLRRDNPSLYTQITENREKLRERETQVKESIERAGLLPSRTKIQGRLVAVGTDSVTNERLVFTNDGRVLGVKQFSEESTSRRQAENRSTRIFPNGLPNKVRTEPSLEGLRVLTDTQLADETVIPEQETEYAALTDDLAVDEGTRIYPTKRDSQGRVVVISGRFRGIVLDDLINRTGRLIEGTAYDFDQKGKRVRFETKSSNGTPNIAARKEPYVTVTRDGRLMIKIPIKKSLGNRDPFKTPRQKMSDLSAATRISTIEKVVGVQNTTFLFPEKDFPAVREAVSGMVLSRTAADKIESYFKQLSRQERAITEEATQNYTLARIGGFSAIPKKDPETGLPVDPPEFLDLFAKQKQAIAWIESKGYSGLVALDTGLGKTLSVIAIMKKMERDGFAVEGTRFLYVCPNKLKGNFVKQANTFLHSPKLTLDRVDRLTYTQFTKARKLNSKFGTIKGDPKALPLKIGNMTLPVHGYAAVFFDEAQALTKSATSEASQAAQSLFHPRKILLTASPMEDDPDELYIAAAIVKNIDLNDRKGIAINENSPAAIDLARFRGRFCQRVGGRTVGLKPSDAADPTKVADFRTWTKSNMFVANKRDVMEMPLPGLRKETIALTMDPAVEKIYRDTAKEVASVLKAAVAVYRDKNLKADGEEVKELFGIRIRKQLSMLNDLANMPSLLIPGTKSPKVDAALQIVTDNATRGVRTLLFTDTPRFAEYVVSEISARSPSTYHAVALAREIRVYMNGRVTSKYTSRRYINKLGLEVPSTDWASHILQEVLGDDNSVKSMVLTSTYTLGQNLQMFGSVVHLDRDTFSSEQMKQRTARAWRTGQDSEVDETTLDMAYDSGQAGDTTLDELRKFIQNTQESLFDEIVSKSQATAIGKDWDQMAKVDASLVNTNRKMVEILLSPFPALMGQLEASK
jgi:hypothetical protein